MHEEDIFRKTLKEGRADYFVEYIPARQCMPFALVNLSFAGEIPLPRVIQSMEVELKYWMGRFAVPVMVSSFDATGELLTLKSVATHDHVLGYRDSVTGEFLMHWGLAEDLVPPDQLTAEKRQMAYQDVPYRIKSEAREKSRRDARNLKWLVWTGLFFAVVVPVLVELIALGYDWLDKIVSIVSILFGLWKIGKAFGLISRSKNELAKASEKEKMAHYFYHCEKNPEGFLRLKIENFEREEVEKTRQELNDLNRKNKAKLGS